MRSLPAGRTAPCPSPRACNRAGDRPPRPRARRIEGRSSPRERPVACPGPGFEKWIFCRPSTSFQVSAVRSTSPGREAVEGTARADGGRRRARPEHRSARRGAGPIERRVRSSFSRQVSERDTVAQPGEACARDRPLATDRTWTTILCEVSMPNESRSRFWYSSSATAATTTSGLVDESTVYCPGWVERRAADRRRRSGDLFEARRVLLPPREPVDRMRAERDEVRGDAEDLDAVLLVPAQNRLQRVEVGRDQFAQTVRRRVRQAHGAPETAARC